VGDGAFGEDIEDQRCSVDDECAQPVFDIAKLGGGELIVEDDDVRIDLADGLDDLVELAGPDVGLGMWMSKVLGRRADDIKAGRLGKTCQFL
jgi:hypothetical protein